MVESASERHTLLNPRQGVAAAWGGFRLRVDYMISSLGEAGCALARYVSDTV